MLKTGFKAFRVAACILLTLLPLRPAEALAGDHDSAAIFVYQGIADEDDGSGNLTFDQFQDQIRELQAGGYTVLPLPDIAAALKTGRTLPDKTVGLSFDGSDKSIITVAAPLLLKARLPFTVFIAPAQLDRPAPDTMGWDDVRSLMNERLVSIGVDGADAANGSDTDIHRAINDAKAGYRLQLRTEPALFAYPHGAYSLAYRTMVEASGFTAAFGQQAGPAWRGSDAMALPRFDADGFNGDIDRFRIAATALPLPVADVEPSDPLLQNDWPRVGFTVDPSLRTQLPSLSCTVADQPRPALQIVGETRVELRLKQKLPSGRTDLNCILPSQQANDDAPARWRWLGLTLIAP